jgi:hypothetical protein
VTFLRNKCNPLLLFPTCPQVMLEGGLNWLERMGRRLVICVRMSWRHPGTLLWLWKGSLGVRWGRGTAALRIGSWACWIVISMQVSQLKQAPFFPRKNPGNRATRGHQGRAGPGHR